MKIVVVCGAGASSTFVAQRVNRAAEVQGRDWSAVATTTAALDHDLAGAAVVAIGPHLRERFDELAATASHHGALCVQLPDDTFRDHDGARTLSTIDAALAASSPTTGQPAGSHERRRP